MIANPGIAAHRSISYPDVIDALSRGLLTSDEARAVILSLFGFAPLDATEDDDA
jgi:hypothetical protein